MKKNRQKKSISILTLGTATLILSSVLLSGCSGARKDAGYDRYSEESYNKEASYGGEDSGNSGIGFSGAQVAKSLPEENAVVTKENEVPSDTPGENLVNPEVSENEDISSDDQNYSEKASSALTEKKIRIVNMEIETKAIAEKAKNLREKVKAISGYMESEEFRDDQYQSLKQMYFTIRIPKDKMDEFLSYVEGEGKVNSRVESLEDIRLQYHDVQFHKKALETEQERVLAMMEKAENIDQLLILESRLTEIRYELERYGTQILEYDNKVDFATLNLTLMERTSPETREKKEESFKDRLKFGFTENLYGIKWFFENLLFLLLVYSPQILILVGIVFICIFCYKAKQRSQAKKEKAPEKKSEHQLETK